MGANLVECLNCGAPRSLTRNPFRPGQADECRRCGYVGWAEAETLTEALRRAFREKTLEQRRTPLVSW